MSEAAVRMDRMYRRQRFVYDATRKYYLLGRDGLVDGLATPPAGRVLEIACGTGRNLIRAARRSPDAAFYGLDVSAQMLATASAAIDRSGLRGRVRLAQADAARTSPAELFGVPGFERVFVSYALSMIPPWAAVLERAADALAPGGSLHVVDFGDGAGLPPVVRAGLRSWLARFDVVPRPDLPARLADLAARRNLRLRTASRFRGYAVEARLEA